MISNHNSDPQQLDDEGLEEVRAGANRSTSSNNLKQLGLAVHIVGESKPDEQMVAAPGK